MKKEITEFLYGGDYNPDQWPEDVWENDIALMKELNVNTVTLPVFSWANLQPAEDQFNFGWLDKVMDLLLTNQINVIMATPTAAQPAWMSRKYPEMLPVDAQGLRFADIKMGCTLNLVRQVEIIRKYACRKQLFTQCCQCVGMIVDTGKQDRLVEQGNAVVFQGFQTRDNGPAEFVAMVTVHDHNAVFVC